MLNYRTLAIGAFMAAAISGSANAGTTILYGNLSNPYGGGLSYNVAPYATVGDGPLGQSFTTGSSPDLALSEVQLSLGTWDTPTTGSFVVTLVSDMTGTPDFVDAALVTLGTVTDASITSAPVSFWGQGYALAANTTYWIVATDLGTGGPSVATWLSAADSTNNGSIGVDTQSFYADSAVTADVGGSSSNFPFVMQVDAPEPVSIALLGVGLAGIGWARSRRKTAPKV